MLHRSELSPCYSVSMSCCDPGQDFHCLLRSSAYMVTMEAGILKASESPRNRLTKNGLVTKQLWSPTGKGLDVMPGSRYVSEV